MFLTMLKGKIHRGIATMCDPHYEGSCSIDRDLLDAAGILVNERIEIYNIANGERFATYAIPAARGSGEIGLNGAAARKALPGDLLIICAYAQMPEAEAENFNPKIVLLNEKNEILGVK